MKIGASRTCSQRLRWTMFLHKKEPHTHDQGLSRNHAPSTMDSGRSHHHLGIWYIFRDQVYTPNAGDGLNAWKSVKSGVKYAEYIQSRQRKSLSWVTGDCQRSPQGNRPCKSCQQTAVSPGLRRGTCWLYQPRQLIYWTPSVTFTAMSRNITLGGRNAARLLKSTIQAGESTTFTSKCGLTRWLSSHDWLRWSGARKKRNQDSLCLVVTGRATC